jgi:uncharacterized protein (DUF302 family)
VFARIDYAQWTRDSGLELNPLVLILFSNPKAGTPLMAQSPSIRHRSAAEIHRLAG